jgi:hypothetical protein
MSIAAIVTDGVVTDTIVVARDALPEIAGLVVVPDGETVGIGWAHSEAGFAAPIALQEAPLTVAQLKSYASAKRQAIADAGLTVNGALVGTDLAGLTYLNGAVALAAAAPSRTFNWSTPTGFVALTATDITKIATAVGTFIQNTFSAKKAVCDLIASGKIKTAADIDAYAWPAA